MGLVFSTSISVHLSYSDSGNLDFVLLNQSMQNVLTKVHACMFVGIAAGAWPCGTITMLGELFGAESKTQIYGLLHTFLQENERETNGLGK